MTGRRVRVVTDSTADLPAGLVATNDVLVVPLGICAGGRSGLDGVDVTVAEVAAELAERHPSVTTSQPSPAAFAAAYHAAGPGDVVSVHLSALLSGTCAGARAAARTAVDAGARVRVVDSGTIAMGLGFSVLAAAEAASIGGGIEEVVAAAEAAARRTTTLFLVESLEALRRGGRIGAAQALLGTALSVKPILHVADGVIAPLEKVRTSSRALARLEDLAVDAAGGGPVDVAVHYLGGLERARALAERLDARLPSVRDLFLLQLGSVVAAHTGPGLLGVVVHQAG